MLAKAGEIAARGRDAGLEARSQRNRLISLLDEASWFSLCPGLVRSQLEPNVGIGGQSFEISPPLRRAFLCVVRTRRHIRKGTPSIVRWLPCHSALTTTKLSATAFAGANEVADSGCHYPVDGIDTQDFSPSRCHFIRRDYVDVVPAAEAGGVGAATGFAFVPNFWTAAAAFCTSV